MKFMKLLRKTLQHILTITMTITNLFEYVAFGVILTFIIGYCYCDLFIFVDLKLNLGET